MPTRICPAAGIDPVELQVPPGAPTTRASTVAATEIVVLIVGDAVELGLVKVMVSSVVVPDLTEVELVESEMATASSELCACAPEARPETPSATITAVPHIRTHAITSRNRECAIEPAFLCKRPPVACPCAARDAISPKNEELTPPTSRLWAEESPLGSDPKVKNR